MRVLAALLVLIGASATAQADTVYLQADFDDKEIDAPIGTGGAAVGEPVYVGSQITAIVRDEPFPTPSLEIADNDDYAAGTARFEFLGGVEVSSGMLYMAADLWFEEYEDFIVLVREQGSSACSFASIYFSDGGGVYIRDEGGDHGLVGLYETGRIVPLMLVYDLDLGTYDFWFDGDLLLADEPHDVTTCSGIGSFLFGCGHDENLDGRMYVDNIYVGDVPPPAQAVCCHHGLCMLLLESECEYISGFFHPGWDSCDPNPCPYDFSNGYVGCSWSETAVPFDLETFATGAPIDLLPEGDYCYDATMKPDALEVWIPGASGDGVVVIDRATSTISQRIPVADYVISVAFSADQSLGFVSSRNERTITRINTTTYGIEGVLPLNYEIGNMALDPISGRVYAVEWYGNWLIEIAPDGSTDLRYLNIGAGLWQLVVSPDGQFVYVTDRGTDQVRVIHRGSLTQVHTVAVGDDPWGIDITDDGGKLVVCCEDSHDAFVITVGSWDVAHIPLGAAELRDVDILDRSGFAFVTGGDEGATDFVYVIDIANAAVHNRFPVPGSNPNVIAVQPQMAAGWSDVPETQWVSANRLQLASWPNPFEAGVQIRYQLPQETSVDLAVFDATGRRLATLLSGVQNAGDYRATWNGRDAGNRSVGHGLYFIRLNAGEDVTSVKAVRLR
jgi:YVTN family beta-propeller protein